MTSPATKRCGQCWAEKPLSEFKAKADGTRVRRCDGCRARYANWHRLSLEERRARMPRLPREGTGFLVALTHRSGNAKTGRIPVSITDPASCPPSCAFFEVGCYAAYGKVRQHWLTVADRAGSWREFCDAIAKLRPGTLWRHNEAGDLPGRGDELDIRMLMMLVEANRGRRGFTFTHKPLTRRLDRAAVHDANAFGFTVNLSANNLEHAGELADLRIAPVVVVVRHDQELRGLTTPAGRAVVGCLFETQGLTCAECRLCAVGARQSVIAFRAHGQAKAFVDELVTLRIPNRRAPAAAAIA